MEIDPRGQKTWPDFVVTEELWGVRAIDTSAVIKEGRRLFYERDGRRVPIARVYNRVIPDELERKGIVLPFDYRDDLDVEWAGHPSWYFQISKYSIPFLRHPSVPRTWFLHELDRLPDDREHYLLKPLFSFAGGRHHVRPDGRGRRGHPGRPAPQLHPAGAHRVHAGHRYARWPHAGRDPHDVRVALFDRSRDDASGGKRRTAVRAAPDPDGPGQDDGRGPQQGFPLGRRVGRVDRGYVGPMQPYVIALTAVSVVSGLGLVLQQFTQTNPIAFLLFVPPILVTARVGGLGPSLLATLVGGLAAEYFFRLPYFTVPKTSGELVPLSLYFLIGSGVSVLADQLARTRQDMQRREREFNTLFRMSPIGIGVATDPECRNIAVNPAFAEVLRIPASANASLSAPLPERPDFVVTMNGVPVPTENLPMQMAARLGVEVRNMELDVDHPDGTRVSLYEYAVPLFDDHGAVRGAMGAFLDITERRRAEEALRQALDENARLYHQAQEANQLKDDFLATLSHELRTPLNALLGWIQLLRSGQLGADTQRRALDAIERSADLQARLTADLLDVSAAMTGKLRLDWCQAAMPPLVEGVVDSLRPLADAKGVHLQTAVDGAVPSVHIDPARMQQVVWNLVSNAIKFTPPAGRVRVRVAPDGNEVVVQVADSGIGISAAFLPFAFDRFRQEDAGPARAHAGLGLGLAIVKHITELHGGRVTVESAGTNQGATFTVRLPATSPTGDPTPPPGPPPAAAPDRQSR